MDENFNIVELDKCTCGMRRFDVTDLRDGSVHSAHVGTLNPHDAAHRAVRRVLAAERNGHLEPTDSTKEN